jgi:hypothetical protein
MVGRLLFFFAYLHEQKQKGESHISDAGVCVRERGRVIPKRKKSVTFGFSPSRFLAGYFSCGHEHCLDFSAR